MQEGFAAEAAEAGEPQHASPIKTQVKSFLRQLLRLSLHFLEKIFCHDELRIYSILELTL